MASEKGPTTTEEESGMQQGPSLPDALWLNIMGMLDYHSLSSAAMLVSKQWNRLGASVSDQVYDLTARQREGVCRDTLFSKQGYLEGLEQGKDLRLQEGFNRGFGEGGLTAFHNGFADGVLGALTLFTGKHHLQIGSGGDEEGSSGKDLSGADVRGFVQQLHWLSARVNARIMKCTCPHMEEGMAVGEETEDGEEEKEGEHDKDDEEAGLLVMRQHKGSSVAKKDVCKLQSAAQQNSSASNDTVTVATNSAGATGKVKKEDEKRVLVDRASCPMHLLHSQETVASLDRKTQQAYLESMLPILLKVDPQLVYAPLLSMDSATSSTFACNQSTSPPPPLQLLQQPPQEEREAVSKSSSSSSRSSAFADDDDFM